MNFFGIICVLIGLFTIICTIKKPSFFWEHRKARFMRKILGNKLAFGFYMLIGVFLLGFGIVSFFIR